MENEIINNSKIENLTSKKYDILVAENITKKITESLNRVFLTVNIAPQNTAKAAIEKIMKSYIKIKLI